jgi:protein-tyrosine phosphatase
MIDIHSHILPGVDDGSPSMQTSIEMLQMAAGGGTTDIVATPHKNLVFPYDAATIHRVFMELSDKASGLIALHLGCDLSLSGDNVQEVLANPAKYTINSKGYLMVELPELTSLSSIRGVLKRMLETRITPIITHPERNASVQANIKELENWISDGCLTQVTAQSLTGRFGTRARRFAESLFQADLVHFVASDAHDCKDRTPVLGPAYQLVCERWGTARAEEVFVHNPASALLGEPVYGIPNSRKSSLFSFWQRD